MIAQAVFISLLMEFVIISANSNVSVECDRGDVDTQRVRAGEALHLPCPDYECSEETDESTISWFKILANENSLQEIGTNESDRVHYHGAILYFLPLSVNDSGHYYTRWFYEVKGCYIFEIEVVVFKDFHPDLLYSPELTEASTASIICPVCSSEGALSWYKDSTLIPGETHGILRIPDVSKTDERIYTCLCTWDHHGKQYNSTGSRRLIIKAKAARHPLTFEYPINGSVELADVGQVKELKCSVFFGVNMDSQCSVDWEINQSLGKPDGYTCNESEVNGSLMSVLTIKKVSDQDFHNEFRCIAMDGNKWDFVSVTLQARASLIPVIVGSVCVLVLFLLIILAMQLFAVDIVLFCRGTFIMQNREKDGKVYDAYVMYQRSILNDSSEEAVAHFVHRVLPSVLEHKCHFKLFIHGRDDLPGEDHMEQIEACMRLSRRLMIILTAGPHGDQKALESYDWQVGIHQALVQGEISVILIQVGDVGEHTHLPLGLKHLLRRSAHLRWEGGSCQQASPSSPFWKRVRYMMPVPPRHRTTEDPLTPRLIHRDTHPTSSV